MNANFYLQCKTCLKILRIRVQAGYYNWIPFTYECPECKVVCRGEDYNSFTKLRSLEREETIIQLWEI